jgi:hypothetical protein
MGVQTKYTRSRSSGTAISNPTPALEAPSRHGGQVGERIRRARTLAELRVKSLTRGSRFGAIERTLLSLRSPKRYQEENEESA